MGRDVRLETLIVAQSDDFLAESVRDALDEINRQGFASCAFEEDLRQRVSVPEGATRKGVPAETYHAYRLGLAAACADVVAVQERDGVVRVPLIRRAASPFAGCWWIMGGVVFNFRPIPHFLLWKLLRECGVFAGDIEAFDTRYALDDECCSCEGIHIVGCLGAARTAAADVAGPGKVCDTINLCYMAVLPPALELQYDEAHSGLRWFTANDFMSETSCGHWYPQWAGDTAIRVYKKARGIT